MPRTIENSTMDFFIHIGTGKTGTSAIQDFLDDHRADLIQTFSCLYPNLKAESTDLFTGRCQNHIELFRRQDEQVIRTQIHTLVTEARKRKIQKIVISYEGLSAQPKIAHTLRETLSVFPDIKVHIIMYIRRQDYWLESAYKQWGMKDIRFRNVQHFLETHMLYFPYNSNRLESIESWGKEFGDDSIIVQPYEKGQLKDGIIIDFLNKLGIDYTLIHNFNPQRDKYFVNVGFNRDIIEIFQLNKNFYRSANDHRLIQFFSQYLGAAYMKAPFEEYSLFSPQERLEIINRYLPQYEIIAKKYLKRADGKLFYEPLPDPGEPWKSYEGLTVEKIVPVYLQMMYNMERAYQKKNNAVDQCGTFKNWIWGLLKIR